MHFHISGVIVDLLGVFVGGHSAQAKAWKEVLDSEGIRSSYPEIHRLMGLGMEQLLPKLVGVDRSSGRGKEVSRRYEKILRSKYLPDLKVFPNTIELFHEFKSRNIRLAIASVERRTVTSLLLNKLGEKGMIPIHISPDDFGKQEPHSEVALVNTALEALNLEPHRVLCLGNNPYDIEAAYSAGIRSVVFQTGEWPDQDLQGAIAIYRDPADLLERFDTSPFGSKVKVA